MSESDRWTVERLVGLAQSMDRAYQQWGNDGAIDRRRVAFGARKWARTKVRDSP